MQILYRWKLHRYQQERKLYVQILSGCLRDAIKNESFVDSKYPQVPGYYILLVHNNKTGMLEKADGKWTGNRFEGIDETLHTIVAWK